MKLEILNSTLCIGKTPDLRAVWQNPGGPPFISIHDAKQVQHLFEVDDSHFERIEKPYTRGSLE
jgi:hypothetical protein